MFTMISLLGLKIILMSMTVPRYIFRYLFYTYIQYIYIYMYFVALSKEPHGSKVSNMFNYSSTDLTPHGCQNGLFIDSHRTSTQHRAYRATLSISGRVPPTPPSHRCTLITAPRVMALPQRTQEATSPSTPWSEPSQHAGL